MNEIMENRGISIPKNPHAPKKLFIAIPLFPAQRIAFYPVPPSVCHLLFANKRIFAACGKMLNGAAGALLTVLGASLTDLLMAKF
jgi:hypothetical protein